MNNPFDYIPDEACEKAFRELTARLESLKESARPEDINLCRELEAGKMLGVLIASDSRGVRHTLYAFSGQLGSQGFHHPAFVGPVFDYLRPDGHFKRKEAEIVGLNIEIESFEKGTLSKDSSGYECMKKTLDAEISGYKEKYRLSKLQRDARRQAGAISDDEMAAMIRRSQFEKAELHRLKKKAATSLQPLEDKLAKAQAHLEEMKGKRRYESEALQKWLFSNFRLLNAHGDTRSLSEIFADTPMGIPPSGAGECCAPKLLQAAYLNGWKPEAIAEYWYGAPKGGEVRTHGRHYPACRGKCLPVLGWMLQGLDIQPPLDSELGHTPSRSPQIIYENQWFCVVDKPEGMLSVPGKGSAVSLQQWLAERYGPDKDVRMAHRLDQDTSGLIVAAFGNTSLKALQSLFATRNVKKTYVADLEGDYLSNGIPREGCISLPLSPDPFDRPRQRIDHDGGKEAMTRYEFADVAEGRSRVTFHPLTGRTHQLRVHAASGQGLGMSITGDRLYGITPTDSNQRLHLHAHRLEFTFPADGRHYRFESPVPF